LWIIFKNEWILSDEVVFWTSGSFDEGFSIDHYESSKLARFEKEQYIDYTSKRWCRIYPKGSKINSSNYDPFVHWNVGCQIGKAVITINLNFNPKKTHCYYSCTQLSNDG